MILASWHDADDQPSARGRVKTYFALLLAARDVMVGVFARHRRVPVLRLLRGHADPDVLPDRRRSAAPQRSYAAVKFLLYNLFGGLLMLAAVIGAVRRLGDQRRHRHASTHRSLDRAAHRPDARRSWLFLGFFFAFAIKAPLWPFHTWLPDAAAEATPGVAVLLVGVLDKVGTFGMLRLLPAAVPRRVAVLRAGRSSRWP